MKFGAPHYLTKIQYNKESLKKFALLDKLLDSSASLRELKRLHKVTCHKHYDLKDKYLRHVTHENNPNTSTNGMAEGKFFLVKNFFGWIIC